MCVICKLRYVNVYISHICVIYIDNLIEKEVDTMSWLIEYLKGIKEDTYLSQEDKQVCIDLVICELEFDYNYSRI